LEPSLETENAKLAGIKALFIATIIICCSGLVSPPLALALGLIFGFTVKHPYPQQLRLASKLLLQGAVVGLGFGMNLHEIIRTGKISFVYTFIGITASLLAGYLIGKALRVETKSSYLISTGTAICGGSAIAAVAPITEASDEQIAVSMGTVFVLNSVALLAFPPIGSALHLSQAQFGLWSALAIHDTSSVVGAAAKYGAIALGIATTVKLARALWIVPLALATAAFRKHKARIQWPWFILLFCLAAMLNTYLPAGAGVYVQLSRLGKLGLTATLFLIGSGVSRQTLRQVGVRPLLQGVMLWLLVASFSLLLILKNIIHL
jgi:uncharacterized integral membrane protein (TIGR00698 family)